MAQRLDGVVHIQRSGLGTPSPARCAISHAASTADGAKSSPVTPLPPHPPQHVQAEVALQVEQAQPGHVADGLGFVAPRPRPVPEPPFDVIEPGAQVDRDALVPVRPVRSPESLPVLFVCHHVEQRNRHLPPERWHCRCEGRYVRRSRRCERAPHASTCGPRQGPGSAETGDAELRLWPRGATTHSTASC